MADYTSGPWTFAPQKGKPGSCFQAQVFGPDGSDLATLAPSNPEEIATANACLIAAAPELLDAAEMALTKLNKEEGIPSETSERLAEAIAKAKGHGDEPEF